MKPLNEELRYVSDAPEIAKLREEVMKLAHEISVIRDGLQHMTGLKNEIHKKYQADVAKLRAELAEYKGDCAVWLTKFNVLTAELAAAQKGNRDLCEVIQQQERDLIVVKDELAAAREDAARTAANSLMVLQEAERERDEALEDTERLIATTEFLLIGYEGMGGSLNNNCASQARVAMIAARAKGQK